MRIETERLIIRDWRLDETPRVLDIQSRIEVVKWLGDGEPQPMQTPEPSKRADCELPPAIPESASRFLGRGLERIFAVTHTDNDRSQAVCSRLGMIDLGIHEKWYTGPSRFFSITEASPPKT